MKSDYKKEKLPGSLRKKIIDLAYKSGCGHLGSCFSCLEILIQVLLYEMGPEDKFILSKGHAALALYVVANYQKKITDEELKTFFKDGTRLGIHPPAALCQEMPMATGSLGHGFSFACGLAKGFQFLYRQKSFAPKVYCLMSDGECNEGSVYEAAQFASFHKLDNLILIIDKNKLQAFGKAKEVLGDPVSVKKWQVFGFNVFSCDGHDLDDLKLSFAKIKKIKNQKPNLLICKTIKGKGVSFMENQLGWHYFHLDKKLYFKALKNLQKRYAL
jgi:transketolase